MTLLLVMVVTLGVGAVIAMAFIRIEWEKHNAWAEGYASGYSDGVANHSYETGLVKDNPYWRSK